MPCCLRHNIDSIGRQYSDSGLPSLPAEENNSQVELVNSLLLDLRPPCTPSQKTVSLSHAELEGQNTWAAWAGRDSPRGSGQWLPGDEVKGLLLLARSRLRSLSLESGRSVECPVCFEAFPPEAGDATVHLWCGCTICRTCMEAWAMTQLADNGGGWAAPQLPLLNCPGCRAVLRPEDAHGLLASDVALQTQHNDTLLAVALRTDPDFVACPKCAGGGFVTDSCLGPFRQDIEGRVSRHPLYVRAISVLLFSLAAAAVAVCGAHHVPIAVSVPGWVGLGVLAEFLHRLALLRLWRLMAAPLPVVCPDCDVEFACAPGGNSHAAGGIALEEEPQLDLQTHHWLMLNTRPCPRCRVPIQKQGGCNHMQCRACKASFCWACMREGQRCRSFACHNGAPFGNASLADATRRAICGATSSLRLVVLMASSFACLELVFQEQVIYVLGTLAKVLGLLAATVCLLGALAGLAACALNAVRAARQHWARKCCYSSCLGDATALAAAPASTARRSSQPAADASARTATTATAADEAGCTPTSSRAMVPSLSFFSCGSASGRSR